MAALDTTCRRLVGALTLYLDGVLDEAERARVEFHLGYCGSCRRYIRQYQSVVRALGMLRNPG